MFTDIYNLPQNITEIKLKDGRPACIFLPYEGKLPTCFEIKGIPCCPYCEAALNKDNECSCRAFKNAKHFNDSLNIR